MSLTSIFSTASRVNLLSSKLVMQYGQAVTSTSAPTSDGLFQSQVGESFSLGRFHPDPATASAATEAVYPRIGHLIQLQTGDLLQDLARLVVYAVMPAQVARVMVGDLLPILFVERKPSLLE